MDPLGELALLRAALLENPHPLLVLDAASKKVILRNKAHIREHPTFSEKDIHTNHPAVFERAVSNNGIVTQPLYETNTQKVIGAMISQPTTNSDTDIFQQVCETMPNMVFVARPTGEKVYVNKRWKEFTGRDTAELLVRIPIHPDDRPRVEASWALANQTENQIWQVDYRLLAGGVVGGADAVYKWVSSKAETGTMRGKKMWAGVVQDINARKLAEQDAHASKLQLINTLSALGNALLFELDPDGCIHMLEGERGIFGIASDEKVVGLKYSQLEALAQLDEYILGALRGESVNISCEIRGRKLDVRLSQALAGGISGIVLDVTEKHHNDIKLREAFVEKAKYQAQNSAAQEASRMKSEFLANMSHEIRTPISGVIGMSELLIETTLNEEQKSYAENIRRSAESLLTVINDILDFSKVEVGKLELEHVPMNLEQVLADVNRIISFAAVRKNLSLERTSNLSALSKRVLGDPGRISQILINLLSNAVKFTSSGSVKLDAHEINLHNEKVRIIFTVQDTGCGIPEAAQRKLFKPFVQADNSTARRFGGTGLGLCICKQLVDLMHGTIKLTSVENEGTTISLQLDLTTASMVPSPLSTIKEGETKTIMQNMLPARNTVNILIAEDNLLNQTIALKSLQKMGYINAIAVENGLEVLKLLKTRTFDLILMDCQMPLCDGYETTSRIRKEYQDNRRKIPIIAMTASAIIGDREKCLGAGMDDYLSKPVRGAQLEAMIVKWLSYVAASQTGSVPSSVNTSPERKQSKGIFEAATTRSRPVIRSAGDRPHSLAMQRQISLAELNQFPDGMPDGSKSRFERSLSLQFQADPTPILETVEM